jgi:uncharacterized protein (DUF433 family)
LAGDCVSCRPNSTLNFDAFVSGTLARHETLARARELVVEDPDILGGTPVIRGTRVPVHDVAASVAKGTSLSRIKAAWPSLSEKAIELAVVYARATPPRGRPRGAMPEAIRADVHKVARRRPV